LWYEIVVAQFIGLDKSSNYILRHAPSLSAGSPLKGRQGVSKRKHDLLLGANPKDINVGGSNYFEQNPEIKTSQALKGDVDIMD